MSELIIKDGQELDIVMDTSLDGTAIEGRWAGDEFQVFFMRSGLAIAGFSLNAEGLLKLGNLIMQGLEGRLAND